MILTRRRMLAKAIAAAFSNLAFNSRFCFASAGPAPSGKPSVTITLDVVDEKGKEAKGTVLVIPENANPQDLIPELRRQARDNYRGIETGDEPRTLLLPQISSKLGIAGVNLPVMVLKANYKTYHANLGPIPHGTSPERPYSPAVQRVQLTARSTVGVEISLQPTKESFAFDVLIKNNDPSSIYVEYLEATLMRSRAAGGLSSTDNIEDVQVIEVDAKGKAISSSGNAISANPDKNIRAPVEAWFPYSGDPDHMHIKTGFVHEIASKDSRRYRVKIDVSVEFLAAHGLRQKDSAAVNLMSGPRKETLSAPELMQQFYRIIDVTVLGHFKDESESSQYNKLDSQFTDDSDPMAKYDFKYPACRQTRRKVDRKVGYLASLGSLPHMVAWPRWRFPLQPMPICVDYRHSDWFAKCLNNIPTTVGFGQVTGRIPMTFKCFTQTNAPTGSVGSLLLQANSIY